MNIACFLLIFLCLSLFSSGAYLKIGGVKYSRGYRFFFGTVFFIFFVFLYVFRQIKFSDTYVYLSVFNRIASEMHSITTEFPTYFEKGFVILNYLISRICKNERFFLLIISFLIYSSFLRFIVVTTENESFHSTVYAICLFVFYGTYFSSTNLMRQYLAISIMLYAYRFAYEKRYFTYFLMVIIAFFFHTTSIICVFVPLLNSVKINKTTIISYFLLLIIIFLFGIKVVQLSLHFILPKYEHYLTDAIYGMQNSVKLGALLNLIIGTLLLFLFLKNLKVENSLYVFFIKIFMFSLLFTTASLKFTQIGRISGYFLPAAYPLFAMSKKNKIFYLIFFCFLGYCLLINFYRPEWTGFFPYSFI